MTFERIVSRIESKKVDSTAKRYIANIRDFKKWLAEEYPEVSIFGIDFLHVEENLEQMKDEGYTKSSIKIRSAALSAFYKEALKFEEAGRLDVGLSENPVEDVDLSDWSDLDNRSQKAQASKEDVTYLTSEQVEGLVENVRSPKLRNELIVRLLFQTGLRCGELVNTRIDDIDTDSREIRVHSKKSHRNRVVYYQPSLDVLMNQWLNGGYRDSLVPASDSPYLFPTYQSEKISEYTITKIVSNAAEEMGIQEVYSTDMNGHERHKITAHTLRHSFAVAALKGGMNLRSLQKSLGHSKLETTEIYLDLAEEDIKEAFARLEF
jgi:integrase/recombinase XerD